VFVLLVLVCFMVLLLKSVLDEVRDEERCFGETEEPAETSKC